MSIVTDTNTNNENINIPNIPEEITASGYSYNEEELDSPETLAAVEAAIKSDVDLNSIPHLNREQRRYLAKKAGKARRANVETISETAKKLTYIKLIEKLREMNKKNEEVDDNEN